MSSDRPTGLDNPFAQAMNQAKTAAEDFGKLFADMKLPAIPGAEALLAAHRRNFEALSAANRIALEGAQVVAKRNMEIMQQTMTELAETMRAMAAADGGEAAERLKAIYERAVANIREVSDLIQRSNGEALGPLQKRMSEAMDEVKTLVEKAKGGA